MSALLHCCSFCSCAQWNGIALFSEPSSATFVTGNLEEVTEVLPATALVRCARLYLILGFLFHVVWRHYCLLLTPLLHLSINLRTLVRPH